MGVLSRSAAQPATPVRKRWECLWLETSSYQAFLRELGDRPVPPSHRAEADLLPYFPSRPKSRDAMPREAQAEVL